MNSENWIITRRRFLGLAGVSAGGLLLAPDLLARPLKDAVVRFGLISDVHYADREPSGTRYYRQSLEKMDEFVALMNREKPDFVIELGDFKDQDELPDQSNTLRYLDRIESAFRKFNGPVYHVLGNHDMDSISKGQFLGRVVNTGIPAGNGYYSFSKNGIHMVVLDANFRSDGEAYNSGNFSWDDCFIPESQLRWLASELQQGKQPVVVFIHQLLDDSGTLKQRVKNAAEVRRKLENSGRVLCVFQGHVHEERLNEINGIYYCSVNGMVDGQGMDNNSYQLVSIGENGNVTIDGYRRASDVKIKTNRLTE